MDAWIKSKLADTVEGVTNGRLRVSLGVVWTLAPDLADLTRDRHRGQQEIVASSFSSYQPWRSTYRCCRLCESVWTSAASSGHSFVYSVPFVEFLLLLFAGLSTRKICLIEKSYIVLRFRQTTMWPTSAVLFLRLNRKIIKPRMRMFYY